MTDLLASTPVARSTLGRRTDDIGRRLRALRARPWGDPVMAGIVGFVLAVAFSWVPSIWYDESATIVSARRTAAELWREIGHVDAVHALYYATMHVWFAVVGYSPFTLRFPSAVAVGVGAALVVLLARELTDRRTGLVAGLLFTLLPRVTWAGAEGRSYAATSALAVALTLVFVHAVRRSDDGAARSRRWWIAYGTLAFLGTTLFLYSALVVVAHGVSLLLRALGSRRDSRPARGLPAARGFIVAAAFAALLTLPLATLSRAEARQIHWLPKPDLSTLESFAVEQWSTGNPVFAALGWALVIVGLVAVTRRRVSGSLPGVVAVALPWLLVPALGLIAASIVSTPLYTARYVTLSAPALAILMAVGLTSLRRRSFVAAGLVVAILITAPTYVQQRTPEAKDQSSWAQVASLVARERAAERKADGPRVIDSIVYGRIVRHPNGSARSIAYAYPSAFTGMVDITLRTSAATNGTLWETRYPLVKAVDRTDGSRFVWLVTSDSGSLVAADTRILATEGFRVDARWHTTGVAIVRFVR
jgi:mannosyltransferase